MKHMPSRDTSGHCRGECRDRVFEGEVERQQWPDVSLDGIFFMNQSSCWMILLSSILDRLMT